MHTLTRYYRPEPLEIGDDTEEEPYTEEINVDSIEIVGKKPIIESNLDSPPSKKKEVCGG